MKKFILLAVLLLAGAAGTYAQQENTDSRAARKAERERQKEETERMEAALHAQAAKALEAKTFVLEANEVVFKSGERAFVNSNTNFILVGQEHGTVQVAFNVPFAGPNGIGGVTVDGGVTGFEMKTDKKGNITCKYNILGTGISAQVFIRLPKDSNEASVDISPNFNSRTLTLRGELVPLEESTVFKGRSW